MPLIKSASKAATKQNFHDLRHGNTYARTRRKSGKKKANKQMVAIAMRNKRDAARRSRRR